MLMTFAILVLLIVPIWLLYRFSIMDTIGTSADTICVILFFTLIFSALLSGFTKAKRHEVLAASAGSVSFSLFCGSKPIYSIWTLHSYNDMAKLSLIATAPC